MEIDDIVEVVRGWAESQPLILRVWIFGSRVRGTARINSDIDIAVEVLKRPSDSGSFTTFVFERHKLKDTLQFRMTIPVDLQWYGGSIETPIIHAALQKSSILVYEASYTLDNIIAL